MYLYFNQDGQLKTCITHGEPVRQGSILNITACFDTNYFKTIMEANNYKFYSVNMQIIGVDGKTTYDAFDLDGGNIRPFEKASDSELTYGLVPGKEYLMFDFSWLPTSSTSGYPTINAGKIQIATSVKFGDNNIVKVDTSESIDEKLSYYYLNDVDYYPIALYKNGQTIPSNLSLYTLVDDVYTQDTTSRTFNLTTQWYALVNDVYVPIFVIGGTCWNDNVYTFDTATIPIYLGRGEIYVEKVLGKAQQGTIDSVDYYQNFLQAVNKLESLKQNINLLNSTKNELAKIDITNITKVENAIIDLYNRVVENTKNITTKQNIALNSTTIDSLDKLVKEMNSNGYIQDKTTFNATEVESSIIEVFDIVKKLLIELNSALNTKQNITIEGIDEIRNYLSATDLDNKVDVVLVKLAQFVNNLDSTKENIANKVSTINASDSSEKYPTSNAVKNFVDSKIFKLEVSSMDSKNVDDYQFYVPTLTSTDRDVLYDNYSQGKIVYIFLDYAYQWRVLYVSKSGNQYKGLKLLSYSGDIIFGTYSGKWSWNCLIANRNTNNNTQIPTSKVVYDINNTLQANIDTKLNSSEVGVSVAQLENGVVPNAQLPQDLARLGDDGKVLSSQLPSYVDDVVEGYFYNDNFYEDEAHKTLIVAEKSKIYIDIPTNKSYRYTGTQYLRITTTDVVVDDGSNIAYASAKGVELEQTKQDKVLSEATQQELKNNNIEASEVESGIVELGKKAHTHENKQVLDDLVGIEETLIDGYLYEEKQIETEYPKENDGTLITSGAVYNSIKGVNDLIENIMTYNMSISTSVDIDYIGDIKLTIPSLTIDQIKLIYERFIQGKQTLISFNGYKSNVVGARFKDTDNIISILYNYYDDTLSFDSILMLDYSTNDTYSSQGQCVGINGFGVSTSTTTNAVRFGEVPNIDVNFIDKVQEISKKGQHSFIYYKGELGTHIMFVSSCGINSSNQPYLVCNYLGRDLYYYYKYLEDKTTKVLYVSCPCQDNEIVADDVSSDAFYTADKYSFRCGTISSAITMYLPTKDYITDTFTCEVVFTTADGFAFNYPSEIKCTGTDCENGVFTPVVGKTYNLMIFNNGQVGIPSMQMSVRGV